MHQFLTSLIIILIIETLEVKTILFQCMFATMTHLSDYPKELLPSNMFSMKSSPILWIGAGLSKRFVDGYRSWSDLLKDASSKFGITEDMYTSKRMLIRRKIGMDASEDEISSELATVLSNELMSKFSNGSLNPRDFFNDDYYNQYLHEVDPLKLLVCSSMDDIRFKSEMSEEINAFKKLAYSIPAIITTNYDLVIETLFDNRFKTYNTVDEYYHSPELGIGEIHKIHGTIKMPRSIVLNSDDYEEFKKRSVVISSKIITLMCESPLLIFGYSMNDWIVRHVIEQMLSSFSREKAAEICQNIIYVQYSEGSNPTSGTMMVKHGKGEVNLRTITTSDFLPIFDDLSRYEHSIPISKMRMIRKMLMDVTSLNVPDDQRRLAYFGIEGVDDVDPVRSVVAITTEGALGATRSYKTYSIDDIIADLFDSFRISPEQLIDVWFEETSLMDNAFIPLFDYLYMLNRGSNVSKKMSTFILVKEEQFRKHMESIQKEHHMVVDYDTFQLRMMDPDHRFSRSKLIAFAYCKGYIDYDDAKKLLKEQYLNKMKSDNKTDTALKMAMTYLGYKRYVEQVVHNRTSSG